MDCLAVRSVFCAANRKIALVKTLPRRFVKINFPISEYFSKNPDKFSDFGKFVDKEECFVLYCKQGGGI